MRTRIIHFTLIETPYQSEVVIHDRSPARRTNRQSIHYHPTIRSAVRLARVINAMIHARPQTVTAFLYLHGWSVLIIEEGTYAAPPAQRRDV